MPRVVHFEIPAEDPDRAVKFYSEVFNWKIEKWTGPVDYRLITTGSEDEPGINGAIMKRQNPQATVTNTIEIPSVDDFLNKIVANGGKIIAPKMPVPGVGYTAYFADTEGNVFGLMQPDTSAH
jgi:predicted enzyme related to lactoylglutathione lyase